MYEWRPQARTYKNSNQEQRNSRNLKSNQGFAHGTYREQDMEQLAAPRNRLSQISVASGCLYRYTGSYKRSYDPILR
jgi:hypothetical protein